MQVNQSFEKSQGPDGGVVKANPEHEVPFEKAARARRSIEQDACRM